MKPENIKSFQRLVFVSILILVLVRVVSALFLPNTKLVLMGARLSVVLSVVIILLLLLYGHLKSLTSDKLLGKLDYTAFLLTTIGVLLIYIAVTKSAHERQVEALNDLIKKLEK